MQINKLFAKPEAALTVLSNYLAQQNRIIESQLIEINQSEKTAIQEALAKNSDIERNYNPEKIDEIKRKIDEITQTQEDSSENQLQNILKLSPLYDELMRLEGDYEYDIQAQYINIYNEQRSYLQGEFSSIQNNSNLVLVYSQLEISLKEICGELKKELNLPIYVGELKGDDMQSVSKYLTKFCGVSGNLFSSSDWKFLDTMRKVRNSIVHNANDISFLLREDVKLVETQNYLLEMNNIDGVTIRESKIFITSSTLVEQTIEKIKSFYFSLRMELAKHRRNK